MGEASPRRWLIWGITNLGFLIANVHRVAPNVVAGELMGEFGITAGILGTLAATYFYTYLILQIPAGALVDRFGPRRMVVAGSVLTSIGSLLFGFAPELWMAFVGRILVGVGTAAAFIVVIKIQALWFSPREFGMASGLSVLMGYAGAVLGATPLAWSAAVLGWRWSFGLIGLLTLLTGAIGWLVIRDLPEGRQRDAETPVHWLEGARVTFGNPYVWPVMLIFFGLYGSLLSFMGVWAGPYLTQVYGLTREGAASYTLLIAVGLMAGGPVAGTISDRVRRRKLPAAGFASVYTLLWGLLIFWPGGRLPIEWMAPFMLALGFFGGAIALTWGSAKEVNPGPLAGMATAAVNVGGFLGTSILQPAIGLVLDFRWQGQLAAGVRVYPLTAYRQAFLLCLAALLITFIGYALMQETRCRNIWDELVRRRVGRKHSNDMSF